ncbi:hypothetical protein GCM10023322_54340 [Rugosimonospora acidiphila]|uniref:Uncharacterized protein n=1 Tax=Rugosimonospora acidiphila TaxID=556531 RepID=A0ABP9SCL1_9ACTN
MRRTTITLTDGQERALTDFAQPGPYQEELRGWARARGIELNDSPAEAALVRVLIDAGIEHVRAHSADVAFRELAEVYVDEGVSGEVTALSGDASGGEPSAGAAPALKTPAGAAPALKTPAGAAPALETSAGGIPAGEILAGHGAASKGAAGTGVAAVGRRGAR